MKKIKSILFITSLLAVVNATASNVCVDNNGSLHCSAGTVDTILYHGFVDLDGTSVIGEFNVSGSIDIRSAKLSEMLVRGGGYINTSSIANNMHIVGNVTANKVVMKQQAKIVGNFFGRENQFLGSTQIIGTVNCDACQFKGPAILIGEAIITNSEFAKSIMLNAKNSYFTQSKLQDIFVLKPTDQEQQKIELNVGTRVRNIAFENKNGVVILHKGAVITGSVSGGEVIKQT